MKAGLVGYPISHSLSPQIFSILSRHYNIPLNYDILEIHPSLFEKFLSEFPWSSYRGFNVTIPYKESIKNYMTQLDPVADAVNVVNVVKVEGDERYGYNTDVYGFLKSLDDEKIELRGLDCVIFGTGGAAKAVIYALRTRGAKSITAVSRRPDQLKYLGVPVECYSENISADFYVNATPLGTKNFHEKESPYRGSFRKNAIAYDLVYRPAKTEFLKHAESAGVRTVGGINMLIWQALKTWEIWFEQEPTEFKADMFRELAQGANV